MAKAFSAQVDDWVQQTKERRIAVTKTAAQLAFAGVQDRTPVDSGFLRATWRASINTPQALVDEAPGTVVAVPTDVELSILGWDGDDPLYLTFSASYAGYVEYGSNGRPGVGMVRLEAQQWQATVDQAVRQVRGS